MNDLNENFSSKADRAVEQVGSTRGMGMQITVGNAPELCEVERGVVDSVACQNGVCSLNWKPLRPAA